MTGAHPDVLRDRYALHEDWGRGAGAGSTYWSGYDRVQDAPVLIQQLHPRLPHGDPKAGAWPPGALINQVRRVRPASDAHLLEVHDVIEESGSLWVVMDPVVPRSLYSLLCDHGRLPPVAAAHIGLEVATALEALHAADTAHGQVDPRGILFREDGTAALPGYGLRPPEPADAAPPVQPWRPNSQYAAPELVAGRKKSDTPVGAPTPQGDLWALGMTLFEMVEGRRPMRGPMPGATIKVLRDARPPQVRREKELAPLIEGLLAPQPGARPKVAAVTTALRSAAGGRERVTDTHWALAARQRRTHWKRLRSVLLQVGTLIGSRLAAAFTAGALAAMLGLRLAGESSAPGVSASVLSAVVIGVSSGLVVLAGKVLRHLVAYVLAWLRPGRRTVTRYRPRSPVAAYGALTAMTGSVVLDEPPPTSAPRPAPPGPSGKPRRHLGPLNSPPDRTGPPNDSATPDRTAPRNALAAPNRTGLPNDSAAPDRTGPPNDSAPSDRTGPPGGAVRSGDAVPGGQVPPGGGTAPDDPSTPSAPIPQEPSAPVPQEPSVPVPQEWPAPPDPRALPDPVAPPGLVAPPDPVAPPPAGVSAGPRCTPRLTLRDGPARVGAPAILEFALDVPDGHPWAREPGHPSAALMLVAAARTAGRIMPPARSYHAGHATEEKATFVFTAHEPGEHRLRFTVYDRGYGVVLQELDATMTIEAPAAPAAGPHQPPGACDPWVDAAGRHPAPEF